MGQLKRILFVQRPKGGGSATGLCDVIRALDRQRFDPVVLFYESNRYRKQVEEVGARTLLLGDVFPPARLRPEGYHWLRRVARGRTASQWSGFLTADVPLARRLAGLIRQERVDVVYQNNNPRSNRASILAARLAAVPQLAQVRFLARYYPAIDGCLASSVDRFLYMSRAVERQFRAALGIPRETGTVLYEPVDFDAFSRDSMGAARVRREIGLSPEAEVVTVVGRLVPWKGQDVFLEAFRAVARSRPRTTALVVGGVGEAEGERAYAGRLRAMARDFGLEERVIFTGFRSDIPSVLAASDVVVHSSSRPEPFGRVVLEAMAVGRPVIATNAGGVPEIIEEGRTGLLVPPGDTQRMAAAIEALLKSPQRRRLLAQAALRRSRSRFDPAVFARRLNGLLGEVLERSGATRRRTRANGRFMKTGNV